MRKVTVAATQMACTWDREANVARAEKLIREAARRGANVVLPVSVFEHANNAFYNSVVIVDAGGAVLGSYRKSHIPEGPGYHEKYYFSPGDSGFKVFDTKFAKLGVAICWDQWFPEAARCMALM